MSFVVSAPRGPTGRPSTCAGWSPSSCAWPPTSAVARRYMAAEGLAKARIRVIEGALEEVTDKTLTEVM